MNFPLCVGNYDLQISWLFYIFNSCFSTFYHILSVPQGPILELPVQADGKENEEMGQTDQ